ncbi:putative Portal protein, HK97 family [Hyphomicrobiales bacterium]|nr:HK97 family phage portal protein [Hyphomicrobiales bacterium]CAH1667729.1 putative Portal protein, HK97 family [Hyphomicrobiales bacterium]
MKSGPIRVLARLFGGEGKSATVLDSLPNVISYPESRSGVTVGGLGALEVTTVLDCVRVLAEGIAQVPLKVYRPAKGGRGSDPATDHPLYKLLYKRPNPWQTSFEFREMLMVHLALCGNAYVFKNYVGGELYELVPLEPKRVTVQRAADLSLSYRVIAENGSSQVFPAASVWHLRGLSWDGWRGLDTIKLAREAVGLAVATEAAHARLHKNGVQSSGVYSVSGELKGDQYKQLSKWIYDHIAGGNSFKPLILDRSAAWTPTAMKGVDAEHLNTRKMQIEEICRAFRVFPQMVGHAGDQTPTFASAEQFFTAHVVHTLGPWFSRIEQSAGVNLIADDDDAFVRFTVNGLMRGAMKDEAEYFAKALGSGGSRGWLTANEVRNLKDMNPEDGGDELPQPIVSAPPAPKKEG